MKVYISQGHQRGIGLEVFFKSLVMLNPDDLPHFELIAFKNTITETLDSLHFPYQIMKNEIRFLDLRLRFRSPAKNKFSQSFSALNEAMILAEKGGILYTLPTSKDQFPSNAGHTEFFRQHYQANNLSMFFSSSTLQLLLLTDHIPVNYLSKSITEELIVNRTMMALDTLCSWQWPIDRLLFAGLNPHAGEKGLIGNEDVRVQSAVKRLGRKYKIEMSGPFSGDTMLLERKSPHDLLIYLYHDQGLGIFKGLEGFIGSNITLGLPYARLSPDHGTSFALFGKNSADYRGCEYSLRQTLQLMRKGFNGKNSSYQGESS
jgi:4-hydroxythreonine-4-phosphate dehydrogenase